MSEKMSGVKDVRWLVDCAEARRIRAESELQIALNGMIARAQDALVHLKEGRYAYLIGFSGEPASEIRTPQMCVALSRFQHEIKEFERMLSLLTRMTNNKEEPCVES